METFEPIQKIQQLGTISQYTTKLICLELTFLLIILATDTMMYESSKSGSSVIRFMCTSLLDAVGKHIFWEGKISALLLLRQKRSDPNEGQTLKPRLEYLPLMKKPKTDQDGPSTKILENLVCYTMSRRGSVRCFVFLSYHEMNVHSFSLSYMQMTCQTA